MSERVQQRPLPAARSDTADRTAQFESIYRAHAAAVTGYFVRRTADPQVAADLTADTFVAAITGFDTFDPRRGSSRGWLFGIARHVAARHWADTGRAGNVAARIGGQRLLSPDEIAELTARIDAERAATALLAELATLPAVDREAIELVDLAGLTPKDAACALGVSAGALRIRLFRARTKLRNTRNPTTTPRGGDHE